MRPRSFLVSLWCVVVVGACSDDAGLVDAGRPGQDAAVPGKLALSWTLSHQGAAVTCAQVDAAAVSIEIVPVGAAFGVVDSLSCTSAMGTSRDLTPGAYDVRLSLDSAGGTLAGPIARRNVTVTAGGTTTVDPVGFDVDPRGDLQFRISTSASGGNCAATGQGGAGITAVTIELRDAGGTCVPTTFAISAGAASPAGTYVSNCAGASHACIASDQDIRAEDIASGPRSMVVTGLVGTAACWKRTTSFRMRGAGLLTTLSQVPLTYDSTVMGCPAP